MDVGLLEKELRETIQGDIHFDALSKRIYSVDASIFEVEPLGIVIPKSKDDLIQTVKIAHRYRVSVIARGAATGITGGCIGPGLIVDLSKYLNKIIEINYADEYVICEPGVVQDKLNEALSPKGYRLGPDTSTGNRATVGGMLANNAAGARSLHYGKMVDHVLEVELLLGTGERVSFHAVDEVQLAKKIVHKGRESEIYKTVVEIRQKYAEEIEKQFPKIPRRVSGYNLDELLKFGPLNLSKLIAGSEGTLGIVVSMKLKIVRKPQCTALCVIQCKDMLTPMSHIPKMLQQGLLSLEMIDAKILEAGRAQSSMKARLSWLQGYPACLFVAEVEGENRAAVEKKLAHFSEEIQNLGFADACILLTEPEDIAAVWDLRKAGLGLLLSKRTYSRAVAFIEDLTIAPEHLAAFMEEFLACLQKYNKEAGIYGHVGAGCIHIRPYVDLRSPAEQHLMLKMMSDVADLLLKHHGAMSGEHGDGYIRSWLNEKMFGPKIYHAFCLLKKAFDPDALMNPGKIVHALKPLHHLRSATEESAFKSPSIHTFLDFSSEGGLELAADLCNGNGLCRKSEGVMCPSFQATRDESDTTRARAQALRAIIHGHWQKEDLSSQKLHEVLDLCLECKGCKRECPSQVDMAKMKSEALFHYQKKRGISLRSWLFGNIGNIHQFFLPCTSLFNWVNRSFLGKYLSSLLGIAPKRSLPKLAPEIFSRWFVRQGFKMDLKDKKRLILFVDTFTEYQYPEIGKAACAVFAALGYSIDILPWSCCGRTYFSKGMLEESKSLAQELISKFLPYAELGVPIVFLEPSCLSMIRDDFRGLLAEDEFYLLVQKATISFAEFIELHPDSFRLFKQDKSEFLVHGHCHQKSLDCVNALLNVLKGLAQSTVTMIDAGCCGMAGSFGYEKEHYDISMQIGGLQLFPTILKAPKQAVIVAEGVSCRQQIFDGTGRHALHLAEVLENRLKV